MEDIQIDSRLIGLLLSRLERISADSYLAHRASGLRGALLRVMENDHQLENDKTRKLLIAGFEILEKAGREMRGHDQGS